jgi:hypothetical protein
MKLRHLNLLLGVIVFGALPAHSQEIGVNFEGAGAVTLAPTDVAGAVAQDHFNNTPGVPTSGGSSVTLSMLADSTGAATATNLTFTADYNQGGTAASSSGYDELFAGGIESPYAAGPTGAATNNRDTLDLSAIPYSSYDVYIYVANAPGSIYQNTSDSSIGTNSLAYTAGSPGEGVYTAGVNYVEFTGLTGATQYFVASDATNSAGGGFNSRIDGFQIVDVVPEPGTWALLGVGCAAIVLLTVRRQRLTKVGAQG